MNTSRTTRRDFLADLGRMGTAGALALHLPLLTTLAGCSAETEHFSHLTPAEARTMRAFAAQILPSEPGSPGAEEAGAVYFVDRAFGDPYFATTVPIVRAGLAALDAHAHSAGARNGFASLSHAEQTTTIQRISNGAFFAAARTLVLTGTFADASYGGNRGGVGHIIVGMEHQPTYAAPFGWYDAQPVAARAEVGT